jgi:hypothetical protein
MDLKRFVGGAPETLVDGVVMALFRAGVREASQNWLLNRLIARNMFRTAGHLLRKLARRWEGSLASLCFGLQVSSEQNERSEFATFTTPQLRWLRDEHGLDVVGTYLLEAAGVTAVSMDFVNDLFNYSKMHVGYASWTDPDLLANLMPLVHSVYSPAPTILQLRQVVTTPWHGSRILDVQKASPLASSVPSVACILADPHTDADTEKEEDLTAHPHLPKFEPLEGLPVYRGGGTHLDRVVMHAPETLVYGVVTALFGAGVREARDPWLLNRLIARDMRRTAGHLLRKLSKDDQGGGPGPGPGPGQRLQEDFVFQLQVPRGPVPITGTIHDEYETFSTAQLQWLRDEHGVDVIGVFLLEASGMQGTWRVRRAVASNCLGAMELAYRSSPDLLVNLLPLLGSVYSTFHPSVSLEVMEIPHILHGHVSVLDVLRASPFASSSPIVAAFLAMIARAKDVD